jgi:O-succinylbenzoic acid--CoA ligase
MLIPAWLPRAASLLPQRTAIEAADGARTYAELLADARTGAGRLAALGAGRGARVAIALAPGLEFARVLHACWTLGAVAVPVSERATAAEQEILTRGAAVVLREPLDGEEATYEAVGAHHADAVAAVVHTSGTTSEPKAVELTYGNWLASALGSAAVLGLDPRERWLCALPLNHVGGLSILVRSAIYGTTAVIHPRFEADRAARALGDDGITVVSLVPTMLRRLVDEGVAADRLRCALIGGGPAGPDLLDAASAAGIPLAQTYGLTEACPQVTTSAIGAAGTAGAPLPGTSVVIADGGEIVVGGPTVAPGARASDGMLHTGDLGSVEDGLLTVAGRASDVVVSGGENVSPAEVEAVLATHPAVADCAVYGRPDPEWGEAVIAAVVLAPGTRVTEEELRAHCAAALSRHKIPKAFEFLGSLPRTASGKLRRNELVGGWTMTP